MPAAKKPTRRWGYIFSTSKKNHIIKSSAVADSYKAHLLCRAALVDKIKVRELGDGSLIANVFSEILS